MTKQLFIAGCGRSGTTALTSYLNDHPRICITTERYDATKITITPDMFSFARLLDVRDGETGQPRSKYEELLKTKDEDELAWIGDKFPAYYRVLPTLAKNNPDCAILFIRRPLLEVAASYKARSLNPKDKWLGGKDGIGLAIKDWNRANAALRQFCERHPAFPLMLVGYHRFFQRPQESARNLSFFLNLDFGQPLVSGWRKRSAKFAEARGENILTDEEREQVESGRDNESNSWTLGYMSAQYKAYWDISEQQEIQRQEATNRTFDPASIANRIKRLLKQLTLR